MKTNYLALFTAVTLLGLSSSAFSDSNKKHKLYNPNPEPLTIVNTMSEVQGSVGGFVDSSGNINGDMTNPDNVTILYPIAGDVYTTVTDGTTGETLGSFNQEGSISATAAFSTSFFGLLGDWSLLPATLPWTMQNDFTLTVGDSIFRLEEPLTGRAFPRLGPVEDPQVTGTMALRMAGCAGIRETSGGGEYAGKVGTICMNGTFTFEANFDGIGVSNCTLALHDPIQ